VLMNLLIHSSLLKNETFTQHFHRRWYAESEGGYSFSSQSPTPQGSTARRLRSGAHTRRSLRPASPVRQPNTELDRRPPTRNSREMRRANAIAPGTEVNCPRRRDQNSDRSNACHILADSILAQTCRKPECP
jgi:hypothetical protein